MIKISNRVDRLSPSATLAMAQKSRELKEQGVDVINLTVGEPDFNTPDFIKEAAKSAIDNNYSRYSPVSGYPVLREAIVKKLKRDNGLDYTIDQISVSNGAKHALANVLQVVVDDGDEVIVPSPYWVTYVELVKLSGGRNVVIEAGVGNDFKITPEQLEAAITPKTRALLFSSPSNPTGKLYTREELRAFADILAKHPNIITISDEIYEYIVYNGKHESIASFDNIHDRVVVVNGVSKAYAMTGYRIGYIAAASWIVKACNKLQGQYTSGPNSVAQIASAVAVNSNGEEVRSMVAKFLERKELITALMSKIPGLKLSNPDGAFYLFPDVTYYFGKKYKDTVIKNADDMSMYLLNEAYVGTVSGTSFGCSDCIRLSYAASEAELTKAAERIGKALANLK